MTIPYHTTPASSLHDDYSLYAVNINPLHET